MYTILHLYFVQAYLQGMYHPLNCAKIFSRYFSQVPRDSFENQKMQYLINKTAIALMDKNQT